uniref:hypothetical protein n=1 Tax=Psychrobacter sp. TaxID=56811 RepID=UPI0015990231|nr:hypothetical protein [Psychrobacter sp.]QJS05544.1 hypothetical protein [Psychrobacter sp.]
MDNKLKGSDLTRAMLERGDDKVLCAVNNDSDEHAITNIDNADYSFLKYIVSFNNSYFLCKDATHWKHAVPVEKVEVTQQEVGF